MTLVVLAFLVFAAILGMLMLQKYEKSRITPHVPPQPQQTGVLLVTLFFVDPDSQGLVREGREINACEDPTECVKSTIQELINGPLGDLAPTLPPNTRVNWVQVEGDRAVVNLGREIEEDLPAGSSAEMNAIYSIVDTVAVNFPRIKSVRFLLEGKPMETLRGHLDLRQPIIPDLSLEKIPVEGPTPETQKK